MKLTKFVHACILVEDDEHNVLFDPGEFSWNSGLFKLNQLPKLDFVAITHEHSDHFSTEFVLAILQKYPSVQFFTTEPVANKLRELGAKNISTESSPDLEIKPLAHASMSPLSPDPNVENIVVHYKNKITHPGDSYQLTETKGLLFLPLAGPWGATIDGVRLADKLKPKTIVPIHDWMWNDEWQKTMYDRMEKYFASKGINFLKTINGQSVQV